jgi:uncharacterized protein YkwD
LRRHPVSVPTGLLILLAALAFAGPAAASSEDDAIDKLNQIRRASGLPGLKASKSLHHSAARYARHMIRADYFGHSSRIAVSSQFGRAGETLALRTGWAIDPEGTVDQWMNSSGHRALLMSSRYRWVGIGLARGKIGSQPVTVWVAHVGAR